MQRTAAEGEGVGVECRAPRVGDEPVVPFARRETTPLRGGRAVVARADAPVAGVGWVRRPPPTRPRTRAVAARVPTPRSPARPLKPPRVAATGAPPVPAAAPRAAPGAAQATTGPIVGMCGPLVKAGGRPVPVAPVRTRVAKVAIGALAPHQPWPSHQQICRGSRLLLPPYTVGASSISGRCVRV